MYTLFISTFDKIITIGLLKDSKLIDRKDEESLRNHSSLTMPMIDNILKDNKITVNDLSEIIVVNGPGSFTGVRIGVTIAKTLAYTLKIKIKTITSLLAYAVSSKNKGEKITIIPDLKGKYIGNFDNDNNVIEYKYLKTSEYNEYIKDKEEFIIDNNTFDLEKIYKYLESVDSINPHNVNPIYIKGIDALNDK